MCPQVAGRGRDLAATDALVLDVAADRLAGEAGAPDELVLPVGLAGEVERGGETGDPLLLGLHVGEGFVEFGHLRLRVHAVMLPHECGQHYGSTLAIECGLFVHA